MNEEGFNAADWARAVTFGGRVATPADVEAAAAVFALGDTHNGRPMAMHMPQPVIWYEDDEQTAALIVQAEVHETDDGEVLQVLGLLLPDGRTAVGFSEDVDEVDATDPIWLSLVEADRAAIDAPFDDDEEDEDGDDA